jgi:hypothetical protein
MGHLSEGPAVPEATAKRGPGRPCRIPAEPEHNTRSTLGHLSEGPAEPASTLNLQAAHAAYQNLTNKQEPRVNAATAEAATAAEAAAATADQDPLNPPRAADAKKDPQNPQGPADITQYSPYPPPPPPSPLQPRPLQTRELTLDNTSHRLGNSAAGQHP